MVSIVLFVAVILGAASVVFYAAGNVAGHGSAWASDLCLAAWQLCNSPELLAIAGIGFGGFYIVLKIATTLRV